MIRHDCEPGSAEWLQLRLGKPTASQAHRIITPTGKPSGSWDGYLHELIAERLLGTSIGPDATDFMQRGSLLEAEAVKFYEFTADVDTVPGGFVTTDNGKAGCSPDRLVLADGAPVRGVEVKCPKASTHVGYMLTHGAVAKEHGLQVQFSLWVTGLETWDLLSYNPELPEALMRITRNEPLIKLIESSTRSFCDELDELHERALKLKDPRP